MSTQRDRGHPRSLRGSGARPDPSRAAHRGARARRPAAVTGAPARRGQPRLPADRRAHHRPIPRCRSSRPTAAAPMRARRSGRSSARSDIRLVAARLARDLPRAPPVVPVRGGPRGQAARGRGPDAPAAGRRRGGEHARRRWPCGDAAVRLEPTTRTTRFPGDARADRSVGPCSIGGALTSAALSIAGAAYVAWRIRHPQSSPMARAVRAVARTRLA